MLQAQMNTTIVKSGGRITARPRITARRMGSNIDGDLAADLDMGGGGLGHGVGPGRQQDSAQALLSSPVTNDSTFCLTRQRAVRGIAYSGSIENNGWSVAIQQLGNMQQFRLLPIAMHPPSDVHQAAGVRRNNAVSPAGQDALHLVFDHVARDLRIPHGKRAAEAAALVLPRQRDIRRTVNVTNERFDFACLAEQP